MIADRFRHWLYGEKPEVPPEVREASHALANEVQQVTARVRQIERAPDPFQELVTVLRGKPPNDRNHRAGL